MITLSFGYKKPEAGDRGAPLFLALETNIQRLNDHTHDGINSSPLPAQSVLGVLQSLPSTNWVTYVGAPPGFYRQLVTVAPGFLYDNVQIGIRLSSGDSIYPTVEKISNSQYYIYTNDNTLNLVAIYGG